MRGIKISVVLFSLFLLTSGSLVPPATADEAIPHPSTYLPKTISEVMQYKNNFDDPRSWLGSPIDPRTLLPPQLYKRLCFDQEAMKTQWAEVIGFRAPERVGRIAPEIKPGKYTYQDLEKYPGLKDLLIPHWYKRIKPGGPPHIGNIPEFEIIPTRQLYYPLPVSEATKRNAGKTKLDDQGYLIPSTWEAGFPFPRPDGEFKAIQVMWNWVFGRYCQWEQNFTNYNRLWAYTRDLKRDYQSDAFTLFGRLAGRVLIPPLGWYDERAKKRGELITGAWKWETPRDSAGMTRNMLNYMDQATPDQNLLYVPSLRRIRKMSATDTQDQVGGQDLIYDDMNLFSQKLSATRYPYDYKVEEREFLVPVTLDGTHYMSSEDFAYHNVKMERRPIYLVTMTQKDPNYVYSKREVYVDAETFVIHLIANYDQRGRLYRTEDVWWHFFEEMGMPSWFNGMVTLMDHVDLHSSFICMWQCPAFWDIRKDLGMTSVVQEAK